MSNLWQSIIIPRRFLLVFLTALTFVFLPPQSGNADPPPLPAGEMPFLFGCDWPVEGSPAVKALFYETGCNFVRLTGGGYGWTVDRHKQALKELDTHGIQALVQLGSHYPDAGYFALKDSYLVDQNGATGVEDRNAWAITYSGSAWPQYSYARAAFLSRLKIDFTAYLDALKGQPNIYALLLHNEPGYHWLDNRLFDYNPQAIAKFRIWLQRQHGTIGNLNGHWGTRFASFAVVEPPHDLPPVSNIAAWLDWRRFNADLIANFLDAEAAFAHRTLPGIPTTTNLSGPLDTWYPIRLGDNYRYTAGMDIGGIDIYPSQWTSSVFPGYALDMTRGAALGKRLIVDECEVFDPARFPGLTEEQRAGMLRSQIWTFIGHGADGILLWSLSGQEGFRLTEGAFNPRVAAVREIAHLAPMLHLETFHRPAARIAVCVDQDSFLFYGGEQPKRDGGAYADQAAEGLYTAVVAGQRQADVVSAAQIRQGLGTHYRALLLSLPVLMDSELAARLRAFVARGGLLVTEAPLAERDRWGLLLPEAPGFGLDAVLGIRHVQAAATEGGRITTPEGTFASQARRQFGLAGAKVAGTFADGQPAVTVHRFGHGTAIYIAAEAGASNDSALVGTQGPSGLQTFLAAALNRYAQISPAARLSYRGSPLLDTSFRRDARGNELIVLADPTAKAKPLPPATQVTLAPTLADAAPGTEAFAFPPARHDDGRVIAGPQPLPIARTGAGPTLSLPPIDSALPVLLARDFPPLLTLNAPETMPPGAQADVRVTCFNPSPKPLAGTLALFLPPSWEALASPVRVAVPPHGTRTVVLRVRSGGGNRAVLTARLEYAGAGGIRTPLNSVPVDVSATP